MNNHTEVIDRIFNGVKTISREEKLQILCSCISGIGKTAIFDKDAVKERIKICIEIAGEIL